MKVLGIHIGHDSSVALVESGRIVADVAEERFTRTKHYCGLPIRSLEYCLQSHKLAIGDIDIIAVPAMSSVPELNHLLALEGNKREIGSSQGRMLELVRRVMNKASAKPPVYIRSFPISGRTAIVHVEHHLAHAASAHFTSGSRELQLIITADGAGDGVSICLWRGEGRNIERLKSFTTAASLGWFYSNVTEALGWWHGDGEGKTMGLAPYGDPENARKALEQFYPKFGNGEVAQLHDYCRPYFWNEGGAIQWHFDEAIEIQKLLDKYSREDVAASAQRILEEQFAEIIYPWLRKLGTRQMSCAGGVFLNVKLNQRIWESGKVDSQHIFPNAGDSGLAAGAALYAYYEASQDDTMHSQEHLYLGPEYSDETIKEVLELRHLPYRRIDDVEIYVAGKLAEGKIVGWLQGRMESGPRALGNRSILMSANDAKNKDIINANVKYREPFRPFCPSMLAERKEDYLENGRDERFMITSFDCPEGKRDRIPAVVHWDGTLRPQTVEKEHNRRYWDVINEFGRLTGEHVILNTSFNIKGEPIVNHPREAIRCFYDSGLDCLAMGNYVVEKGGNTS